MAAKHREITQLIIRAYYTVYNTLGYGFPEKIYHNAMVIELQRLGLKVIKEHPIVVYYEGECAGEFFADLLVNNAVIVELKALQELHDRHEAQTLSYLKACTIEVGLLLNFGPEPEIRRITYDNHRKGNLSWLPKTAK